MIEKLTISEDIIKLIPHFNFTDTPSLDDISGKEYPRWGIDCNSIYGGTFLLEDLAMIFGVQDTATPGTEENPMGPRYPEEVEDRLFNAHTFVTDNFKAIEEIIHQFVVKGGITAGTYKCDNKIRIWEKE